MTRKSTDKRIRRRHTDPESRWIRAANAAAGTMPLFYTPIREPGEKEPDIYQVIYDLARTMGEGKTMRVAEEGLRRKDQDDAFNTTKHPSDLACDLYTPQMDSAYFLGLAMGLRLARTLGTDGGAR